MASLPDDTTPTPPETAADPAPDAAPDEFHDGYFVAGYLAAGGQVTDPELLQWFGIDG
jgi:hypothetical protein